MVKSMLQEFVRSSISRTFWYLASVLGIVSNNMRLRIPDYASISCSFSILVAIDKTSTYWLKLVRLGGLKVIDSV